MREIMSEPTPPLYTPEQRAIFQYHDGTGLKWADPVAIRRRIYRAKPELESLLTAYNRQFFDENGNSLFKNQDGTPKNVTIAPAIIQLALDAEEKMISAARYAFNLPAVDPILGPQVPFVSDDVPLNALLAFLEFEEKNSKRDEKYPIGSVPTA
jgi:hypothetical protein